MSDKAEIVPSGAPVAPAAVSRHQANPAAWTYERIAKQIQDFEAELTDQEEVGARVIGLPGSEIMLVEDAGYWGPDLLFFYGTNQHGKPMQLIQHYTQISLLLTALPKEKQEQPPRRIGFHLAEKIAS
jgi:hypothetical protein